MVQQRGGNFYTRTQRPVKDFTQPLFPHKWSMQAREMRTYVQNRLRSLSRAHSALGIIEPGSPVVQRAVKQRQTGSKFRVGKQAKRPIPTAGHTGWLLVLISVTPSYLLDFSSHSTAGDFKSMKTVAQLPPRSLWENADSRTNLERAQEPTSVGR